MAAVEERAAVDSDKLMGFVFRAVGEDGATLNTAPVTTELSWEGQDLRVKVKS
jgi:hypothetical protein